MNFGNLAAYANAFVNVVTAGVGVKLTLDPVVTDREKSAYKVAFGLLAVLGLVLAVVQVRQDTKERRAYADQLTKIQSDASQATRDIGVVREQTKEPPKVTVNVPQPLVQVLQSPPMNQGRPGSPSKLRLIEFPTILSVSAHTNNGAPAGSPSVIFEFENLGGGQSRGEVTAYVGTDPSNMLKLGKSPSLIGFYPKQKSTLEVALTGATLAKLSQSPTEFKIDLAYAETSDKPMRYIYRCRLVPGSTRLVPVEVVNRPR